MFLKKLKTWIKGNNNYLKKSLNINQKESTLLIEGALNKLDYKVKELWFVARNGERTLKIQSDTNASDFNFNIDLNMNEEFFRGIEDIFNLYILVSISEESLTQEQINDVSKKADIVSDSRGRRYYEYPIRLGRFKNTKAYSLDPIVINGNEYRLYKTNKGNISLSVNFKLNHDTKTQINYMTLNKSKIKLGGKLFTKSFEIRNAQLILKSRSSIIEAIVPIHFQLLKDETEKKFGLNRYEYKAELFLNEIFENNDMHEDIYDVFMEVEYDHLPEKVRVRLGHPRFFARFNVKSAFAKLGNDIFAVSPYFTIKFMNLSFQVDKFEAETYKYMSNLTKWYWLLRLFYKSKNIWIVGERPYKAQDTGYHFFKYMREMHPEQQVYYVIEEDSPEIRNVKDYGNILHYKSKKHVLYTLMATRIIGSHHPDYLFPLRTNEFKRKVKALKVFLQHGVMGTKNTVHFYGKTSPSFDTDLFMVSSDLEKSIIVNDFGYLPKEVKVTGLPRFDSLLKGDVPTKRQLLIIPTWREWLVNEERFLESEYFSRYQSLVNNSSLHKLAKDLNFEIVFCLHPNMQMFTHFFKDAPVRVVSQGEIDVQYLLKESAMMITDYSSVAFDFSFLSKPIVYYQFDRDRFIGKKGSHLNLDEDLPGDIVFEEDQILECVEEYAKKDFEMSQENKKKASRFLKYKDLNSSERIYNVVKKAKKNSLNKTIFKSEFSRVIYRRLRKSKYYFPIMKVFYNFAKRVIPIDQKMILFESGLGKQYSDSPRYIYEEILKRNLNYKKVWISNKKVNYSDPNTIHVQRLSPQYYYYLAKSKFWVNNQNFPTYIKKRPETVYVQTWHGTPLKKMLFDIRNIMGRSDDYLERVYSASKTWSYLISPSSYATKAFKSAFKYEGEVLEIGYPRNDLFYKKDANQLAKKIRHELNIPEDKKVILYAPTFRDNQTTAKNKFIFDIKMDLEKLKETIGDDYIILLRMHVAVTNRLTIDENIKDFVYDVSKYDDIQELYLISDILMTDYSSVMFDFANTKRPILFFTYDLEEYRDDIRGFYMDFINEAPGPFLRNTEDIIESVTNIKNIELEYKEKYKAFYEKYCKLEDGNASSRLVDKIFD
ncbi:CDP-glycerol glycerophosphotransferase family protein [Bacillus sp. FJAT-49711]|uniref:CDP-glycerol glycerophosphotransferase family protein n=1 Tax=Bacillus sp. FJAT-49711 TaxID=2833585 RepID=UPI001BC8D39E|nr:CDP-glycerol glycerophosphotransferase family protein [Bacillus sp. FJAT-49711]MBS4218959.1 CDP-glycerol glycerophosphotransferase family protein [Bacillus sp. FJAT-49711]